MEEEGRRCYEELGIRGIKMVPDRWSPDDERLLPLWSTLADLGMYVAFHSGIFLDERSSRFCRPAGYEGLHRVPGFHGHLAHLFWPWDPRRYLEQFIYPQLANFETAATLARHTPEAATADRIALRRKVFYDNAVEHWEAATRSKPQRLQRLKIAPSTPNARPRRSHRCQSFRAPGSGSNQPTQTM